MTLKPPISRDEALRLVREYTASESLVRHMLAVEAAMRAYACKFGEDEDVWGMTGLLHDFDYERWPNAEWHPTEGHPCTGVALLRDRGFPEPMLDAILGHAEYTGVGRRTQLARTLFAVDELCGFIVAVAQVRAEGFAGMEPKSVKKKLKAKAFAAKVSREDIRKGIEELGVAEDAHIALCIEALNGIAADLGFPSALHPADPHPKGIST